MFAQVKKDSKERLTLFLIKHPWIKIKDELGTGNFGEAYLIDTGKVLKLTFDIREYTSAKTLKGKYLDNFAEIYNHWEWEYYCNESNYGTLYCIIIERIFDVNKKEIDFFVSALKHAWFCYYFPSINKFKMWNNKDMDQYMKFGEEYGDAIAIVKNKLLEIGKEKELSDLFESTFIKLLRAYKELYKASPESMIDMNSGNIGFSPNGELKIFDVI